jgi:CRP/FNR family cyclic AMP-dependent transcriptional regulator
MMESNSGNKQLKRGELLFSEGDTSRAMYLLKSGSVRLFMKRGNSDIEIDTVRSGQILGELAFLDGNPRSVSGEALQDCELVEISGPTFLAVLSKAPEWLKILLKTVVGRLRATNAKLRQLETANVALDYSERDGGKRTSSYQFLSVMEFMKVSISLLVVGTRNGAQTPEGVDIDLGLVNRYANQIMGVPLSKTSCALDVYSACKYATTRDVGGHARAYLKDLKFIELLIQFLNEENQLEVAKKHEVSARGLIVMRSIAVQASSWQKDEKTGLATVNVGALQSGQGVEHASFKPEDLNELVTLGYLSELNFKSEKEILTTLKPIEFVNSFRFMQIVYAIREINEQKRKIAKAK